MDNTSASFLLTKTQIHTRNNQRTQIYDLSGVESFDFDRTRQEAGWKLPELLVPVRFPLGVLLALSFAQSDTDLCRGGPLFAQISKTSLSYQTLMRLAAVALTPVLILNLIFEFPAFQITRLVAYGTPDRIGLPVLRWAGPNAGSARRSGDNHADSF